MRKTIPLLLASALVAAPALAAEGPNDKDRKVFDKAVTVLETLTSAPDDGIPEELMQRAECVLVFPDVTKGAFIVGGRYGRGVALCREASGEFGSPAYFSMGGGSIGWQWGGQQTDFVLLVMNRNGMKNLLEDEFTLGVDATAAVGPVGRTASASTDAQLQAQILSWSRSQGLFVGAALEGAVVKPSDDANTRLYGREIAAKTILSGETTGTPAVAAPFVELTTKLAQRPEKSASNR